MSDSPAPKPRRSWLQFSLRLLLLGLTAFAIGFPIWYRWPYEETELIFPGPDPFAPPGAPTPHTTITRTWRRSWGGGKVQSGRTVKESRQGRFREIEYFENGVRQGPIEVYSDGKLIRSGRYEQGQREGTWTDQNTKATTTSHWHQDLLDGTYEIAFKDGRNRKRNFSQGRLIDFEGRHVQNRLLEQLAAGEVEDPQIAKVLLNVMPVGMEFIETPLRDAIAFLQDQNSLPLVIDSRRITDVKLPITVTTKGMDLCSALNLLASPHDMAFEYRYGVLRLTTAEHAGLEHDPTGVTDIRPPPDSPLARAWNEPCRVQAIEIPLDKVLQSLGQPLEIEFDLPEEGIDAKTLVTKNLNNLPLKHVLGHILDGLDLRCEVRDGDTIAILPQKAP